MVASVGITHILYAIKMTIQIGCMNTEHLEVQISNSLVLEWLVIAKAMVPTILKLNHW